MERDIAEALRSLPRFDDPYLNMQATNISIVDHYLQELELDLLRARIAEDRTPQNAYFVSALSQLWIFGAYELLRTWRQRAKANGPGIDPAENQRCKDALDNTEGVFRIIEALRVTMAKHEIPKTNGVPAHAPGYARIDNETGSMLWLIEFKKKEAQFFNRKEIGDFLRKL